MVKRYQIVSNCLSDVRKAEIRTIDRLQLEVALYRLKLVLLAEEETLDEEGDAPEFAGLAEMGRRICSPERTSIEIQKFVMHLNEIKEKLLIRSGGDSPHPGDTRAR